MKASFNFNLISFVGDETEKEALGRIVSRAVPSPIVEYDGTAPVRASANIGSLLRKRRRHG
jgi:hypothetical protein